MWDEIGYLYDKVLYWLYERQEPRSALPFAERLEQLLDRAPPNGEAIWGEECRSLVCEGRSDLPGAIRDRENEIRLIERLHEISRNTPAREYVLCRYDYDDLSDRLDLLAVLYHANGDLDRAIGLLEESRKLCAEHHVPFDGQDVLQEYLSEKEQERQHG